MSDFGKVAVLYGGFSAEREVSLKSGKAVLSGLLARGVDAHGIDVGEDIVSVLQAGQFDLAFNVLHGRGGEDGTMQALLEFLQIPYCGSGVAASALAMDKLRAKWVWQANELPTPAFLSCKGELDIEQVKQQFTLPLCVKPVHEGSSCGVSKVKSYDELPAAVELARQYHDEVIIERWIEGEEYTASIIADEVYPSVKISTPREFYDYEAKYLVDSTVYDCPSGLDAEAEAELAALAQRAYRVLGCKGWGRVDFMRDVSGDFWLIEMNTVPGMTETSLLPKAARAAGVEFPDLVVNILSTSGR